MFDASLHKAKTHITGQTTKDTSTILNKNKFKELEAEDAGKCREVYKQCLRVVPHAKFSFSKIWVMFANFEVRQQNLDAARAVFGNAMRRSPNPSIFGAYIYMDQLPGNMDRCRAISGKTEKAQ